MTAAFHPSTPEQEALRQRSLERLKVLDTPPEPQFDELVELAAELCGTPMAAVSLLSSDRQWFKARLGLDAPQTPREAAFCNFTAAQLGFLEVPDASADARFAQNPLVTGPPLLRFYAGAPLVMPEGVAVGALCVLDREPRRLDARQRRMLEVLARQAGAQLELRRRLVEETAARSRAEDRLSHSDRLALVGELAAGLAHELGTPLAVVLGRARMLSAGGLPAETCRSNAVTIAEQAERMSAILRQMLDFARRREPRKAKHELRSVLQQSVTLLRGLAEKRNARLLLEESPQPVTALFDPTQLAQVVNNLVMNAVQAMPRGGPVKLSCGEAVVSPPGSGAPAARHVWLKVTDAGEGMTLEQQARIFEPFFTTKDTGEGTGLGLPVSAGIVRDHCGWFDVQSERGHGSTFTVYLPG